MDARARVIATMKLRPTAVDPERLCRSGVSFVPVPVPLPVPEKG